MQSLSVTVNMFNKNQWQLLKGGGEGGKIIGQRRDIDQFIALNGGNK